MARAVVLLALLGAVLSGCGSEATAPVPPGPTGVLAIPSAAPELSAAVPAPSGPRPENGAVVTKRGGTGRGELAIDNGADEDALVSLSRGASASYAVYVRAGESAQLTGIEDGDYRIFVTQGEGWNGTTHRFTASADYSRFDESAVYTTQKESGGVRYTRLKITLQPAAGGNAQAVPVDPDAYPT